MEERYIAAVDLGSSKIALTVAKIAGDDIQILYYKERKSDGIRNSAMFKTTASVPIKEAIAEAEKELNIKILQVVVGLPRCDIRQEIAQARVERCSPDESITLEEVEGLKCLAQDSYPLVDHNKEEIYGAIAQSFSDDENFQLIENDIIGVISDTFEGNFKLFVGKRSSVKTLEKVFYDLGIAIARKYFTPDTISNAVLTQDEMENGVALIDFGGGATSVTIYKGKILRHYASIPFGGKTITSDIRSECSISESLAENIKLAYGACQPDRLQVLMEKIIQIEGDDMEAYKQIPVKYLSEIITARATEMIDAILYEIQMSGLADGLRNGIVITGGGANLCNIGSLIKEMSGYNVRMGYPRRLFSSSDYPGIMGSSATNSIGMILAAKNEGLISCVDPVESYAEEEEEVTVETMPEVLFPDYKDESKEKPEEKKPVVQKPNKKKKPDTKGTVTWTKKLQGLFGDIYKGAKDTFSADINEVNNEDV